MIERIACAIIIIGALYGFCLWAKDIFAFVLRIFGKGEK